MRAQLAWKALLFGLTLSAAVGCGTDRTGLQPGYQPVQPERSDGPGNPQPVRPGATTPPATPATDDGELAADARAQLQQALLRIRVAERRHREGPRHRP